MAEPLKNGEKVVMHTCMESHKYDGQIWTVESDEWDFYGQNVVNLHGFNGVFATKFLQRVRIEGEQHA